MIIITGSGRSGTSITAKLFELCGFNLGPDVRWIERFRAGYEAKRIARMNDQLISQGLWAQAYSSKEKIESLSKEFGTALLKISEEYEVVKDPRFTATLDVWWKAGVPIDLVIICLRDPEDCIESAKHSGAGFSKANERPFDEIYNEWIARMGKLYFVLHMRKMKYATLRYDNFVNDFLTLPVSFPDNVEDILNEKFRPVPRI